MGCEGADDEGGDHEQDDVEHAASAGPADPVGGVHLPSPESAGSGTARRAGVRRLAGGGHSARATASWSGPHPLTDHRSVDSAGGPPPRGASKGRWPGRPQREQNDPQPATEHDRLLEVVPLHHGELGADPPDHCGTGHGRGRGSHVERRSSSHHRPSLHRAGLRCWTLFLPVDPPQSRPPPLAAIRAVRPGRPGSSDRSSKARLRARHGARRADQTRIQDLRLQPVFLAPHNARGETGGGRDGASSSRPAGPRDR
jgi:hypothetical protein